MRLRSNCFRFVVRCLLPVALYLTGGQANAEAREFAPTFGSFNFDFPRLAATEAEQIDVLRDIGYAGVAMNLKGEANRTKFDRYQQALSGSDEFSIYAGYVLIDFKGGPAKDKKNVTLAIERLASVGGSFWLIVRNENAARHEVMTRITTIADEAQAAGVELVLYPHDNTYFESAEEALVFIQEIGHDNLFVSLHLCHEIRAGNGERLEQIAEKIEPWLRLPTMNGANVAYVDGSRDWSDSIQPLGAGDYDAAQLLNALKSIHYKGPIILHTFGLQEAPIDHHQTSFEVFTKWLEE